MTTTDDTQTADTVTKAVRSILNKAAGGDANALGLALAEAHQEIAKAGPLPPTTRAALAKAQSDAHLEYLRLLSPAGATAHEVGRMTPAEQRDHQVEVAKSYNTAAAASRLAKAEDEQATTGRLVTTMLAKAEPLTKAEQLDYLRQTNPAGAAQYEATHRLAKAEGDQATPDRLPKTSMLTKAEQLEYLRQTNPAAAARFEATHSS